MGFGVYLLRRMHAETFGDEGSSVTGPATLGALALPVVALAGMVLVGRAVESPAADPVPAACQQYVELRSAAAFANEIGRPESWVADHYRIALWSSLAIDRSRSGEMQPGRLALILERNEYGYRVSTGDGTEGWVSNFQVGRTLQQDAGTRHPCQ